MNETKLITDSLWKSYEVCLTFKKLSSCKVFTIFPTFVAQYTDDLVPLMEFTNEQLGAASKEIFTGLHIFIPPITVLFLSTDPPNTS